MNNAEPSARDPAPSAPMPPRQAVAPSAPRPPAASPPAHDVIEVRGQSWNAVQDVLAEEVPIALQYDGRDYAVMMATPADLQEFAIGFSHSEGLAARDTILFVDEQRTAQGIILNVITGGRTQLPEAERLLPGRSGCGLCGSRALATAIREPAPVATGAHIDPGAIERALAALRESQPINGLTGSVHAAAWALPDGSLQQVREDVGRHNALDKLIGALLSQQIDTRNGFLVLTSRASYEMVTKAASAGIAVLAAISAPTALAVQLAQRCNMSLIGFARPGRHVIYSGSERLA